MRQTLFDNTYDGLTVLVTGHTGFKGSWLSIWLAEMGANVIGYSLPAPPTRPSNFNISAVHQHTTDIRGDLRDFDALLEIIETHRPAIIFHMAAQPLVLESYKQPKLTFDTNAGGTVSILEAIRRTGSVKALVCITTDKVYKDQDWIWGYRETDPLGNSDLYGASKAMAELAVQAYRESFFNPRYYDRHGVALATTRAGNVIGGGDFAAYRLVPDSMRALMADRPIELRIPGNVRPWQHVLEPLAGYLWLANKLLKEGPAYGEAWNFGPGELAGIWAAALVEKLIAQWGSGRWIHTPTEEAEKETRYLRLNWVKAAERLGWRPVYSLDEALAEICRWFKAHQEQADMYAVCREAITAYVETAAARKLAWAG